MNISANISYQSYFMPIIFRANQISGKDEIAKNECSRAYKSSGMQVSNDVIQGGGRRREIGHRRIPETTILYVDPWILFDHETITASYGFVAEVSSLDDYFYSSLDDRVYPASPEVQLQ